jgi:hypothetical protein
VPACLPERLPAHASLPCPALPPHLYLLQNADKGDLVETFSKVMGVFVHYTDEQVGARGHWGGVEWHRVGGSCGRGAVLC